MSESHQREAGLFDAAMELPPEQRAAYLDQACGGDTALRQRMESLLKAGESQCDFLNSPTDPALRQTLQITVPPSEKPGDRIGHYKLLEQIGEGGCGVVYVAEQTDPVRRRVALKIIKLGMDTKSVIARFEAERQALALMDHPNIAKVFDAGATETGRPYFVMELVRGMKITDFCDEKQLSTRARLDLFIQVCQAIQHAHQKGIIHRDIKPSNILVTVNDGVAVPTIIDFGIAKATSGQLLTDKTIYTAFEQFIGTPAYMSPEQAVLTSLDIDTRSDIYALGVLLFELLTGKTPFDPKELLAIGLDEMRRTIRESEPPRPSTRVSTLPGQELSTTAHRRGLEPPKLVSELRGDLDWIVVKCLEKDRARRYETANGLALDIQRHLDNEPVMARPPSRLYRFQKLVRRNKLAFAAAGAVVAALLVGLGISTWMFFQERAALQRAEAAEQAQKQLRQEAENETAKSRQVAQFFQDMLAGVGPSVALGRETTLLREILDKTVERVGKELTNQPGVELEMRLTLASTYDELGLYQQEEQMARESVRLARSMPGGESEELARSLLAFGWALSRLGNLEEAENSVRQALAIQTELHGSDSREVADSLHALGIVVRLGGKLEEAEAVSREALALRRKVLGNEHPDVMRTLNILAIVLERRDKLAEAETLYRQALAMGRKLLGDEHPDVAKWLNNLAFLLARRGNLAEAETLYRDALAMGQKLVGTKHPEVARTLNNLANVLARQGKWKEAANSFADLIQNSPTSRGHYLDLANLLAASGDLEGYQRHCKETVSRFGDTADPNVDDMIPKACSILPASGTDPEVVAKMAAAAAAAGPTNRAFTYFQCTAGMVEYRRGRFANAVDREDKALRALRERSGNYFNHGTIWVEAYAVSAMAHFRLGQTEEARAALVKASCIAARRPRLKGGDLGEYWGEWTVAHKLLDEAWALIAEGSNINMDQMLDDLVSKAPDSRELLNLRANYRAQQGRWKEAAADFVRVRDFDPDDHWVWNQVAVLLAAGGQSDLYRKHCRQSAERFHNASAPNIAERMAKDCLLLPDSGADPAQVAQMVDMATAATNHYNVPWFQLVKGLAEYRQGRFASAAAWASTTLTQAGSMVERDVQAYMVLAMAQYRLKQTDEARAAFAKGAEIQRTQLPTLESGDIGGGWLNWIMAYVLGREAKALIEGSMETESRTK